MDNELEKTASVEVKTDPSESEKQIETLKAEIAKLKQSVTNASADASKWKKEKQEVENQLKSRMTEEEKAKAEQDAATAALQQELEMLRNERNVANHKAELASIGFDDALAQETAEAINAGDTAKLFAGIRKFIASHDKDIQAKSLLSNPVLPGGGSRKTMSREEFESMGYTERVKLYNEDPELYKEMTKTS